MEKLQLRKEIKLFTEKLQPFVFSLNILVRWFEVLRSYTLKPSVGKVFFMPCNYVCEYFHASCWHQLQRDNYAQTCNRDSVALVRLSTLPQLNEGCISNMSTS